MKKKTVKLKKELPPYIDAKLASTIQQKISQRKIELSKNLPSVGTQDIKSLQIFINEAKHICLLTGAGFSTMSGIPDYRSAVEGLWRKKPTLLASLNEGTFRSDPVEFWKSYRDLLATTLKDLIPYPSNEAILAAMKQINPNEAHKFFAGLEAQGKKVTVITQNVDGLHQKAGSTMVHEIHGNITSCICPKCENSYDLEELIQGDRHADPPLCDCGSILRPEVVFFGDEVKGIQRAMTAIQKCDLIIVAGTSLQVQPFNHLPLLAKTIGIPVVYVNGEKPENEKQFDQVVLGNIEKICQSLTP